MVVLDTKPTIELLREQAALPTDQHFILRQHLDRKKKPTLRLEDRRKVCMCVCLTALWPFVQYAPFFPMGASYAIRSIP